jgi:hypothetical protein
MSFSSDTKKVLVVGCANWQAEVGFSDGRSGRSRRRLFDPLSGLYFLFSGIFHGTIPF